MMVQQAIKVYHICNQVEADVSFVFIYRFSLAPPYNTLRSYANINRLKTRSINYFNARHLANLVEAPQKHDNFEVLGRIIETERTYLVFMDQNF